MTELERSQLIEAIDSGRLKDLGPLDLFLEVRSGSVIPDVDRTAYSWLLSGMGEWDAAQTIALSILDTDERGQALGILAQRLAERNMLEESETSLRMMSLDPADRGAFVEALQARLILAAKRAETLDAEKLRADLKDIEGMIARRGRTDALQVSFLDELARIWSALGETEASVILLDRATEVAKESTVGSYENAGVSDVDSWQVLVDISRSFISLNEVDRARAAIGVIPDRDYQRNKLRELGI